MTTASPRTLLAVRTGDTRKGKEVPRITLMGKWLANAGFPVNCHVSVCHNNDGSITIRQISNLEISTYSKRSN